MSTMRGHPAGRGGAGGGGEPLPLGAAGLVDVHVGVDQPGQQRELAEVDCRPRRDGVGSGASSLDRGDPLAGDTRPRPAAPVRQDGPTGPDHEVA